MMDPDTRESIKQQAQGILGRAPQVVRDINDWANAHPAVANPLAGAAEAVQQGLAPKAEVGPPVGDQPRPPAEAPPVYGQDPVIINGPGIAARPAGWTPSSSAATVKHGMSAQELAPLAAVQQQRLELGEKIAQTQLALGEQQGIRDAAYKAAEREATAKHDADFAALQRRREDYVAAKKGQLDQLATQAQAKADPEAYWREKGTLAQVASAIAIGMGSFAASINKGPNFALDIINSAIDRNMRAQELNIRNAKQGFDVQSSLLAQNMQAFGDKEQALKATRAMYLDQVASQLDDAMAKSGVGGQLAKQKMQDALLAEREKVVRGYIDAAHDDVTEQQQNVYHQATQGAGSGDFGMKDQRDLYVPSVGGLARTKEEASKLRDHDARTRTVNMVLSQAQDLLKEANSIPPTSLDNISRLKGIQAKLDSLRNSAAVKQTVKEGQGAMSAGDKVVSDETLGLLNAQVWDPASLATPGGRAMLHKRNERAIETARSVQERALSEHRILGENLTTPAQEFFVRTPKGLEPRHAYTGKRMPLTSRSTSVDDVTKKPEGREAP